MTHERGDGLDDESGLRPASSEAGRYVQSTAPFRQSPELAHSADAIDTLGRDTGLALDAARELAALASRGDDEGAAELLARHGRFALAQEAVTQRTRPAPPVKTAVAPGLDARPISPPRVGESPASGEGHRSMDPGAARVAVDAPVDGGLLQPAMQPLPEVPAWEPAPGDAELLLSRFSGAEAAFIRDTRPQEAMQRARVGSAPNSMRWWNVSTSAASAPNPYFFACAGAS